MTIDPRTARLGLEAHSGCYGNWQSTWDQRRSATMISPFLALPAELLLIILGDLCDIRYFPSRTDPPYLHTRSNTIRILNGLRAISTVNRRLRNLSLRIRFRTTRCSSSEKFEQLSAKCTTDSQFARFIVQLDVVDIDTRQLLPELLPCLTSLVRLDLHADALDARVLAIANAHPTLLTVAIPVALFSHLETLANIPDLPFSKILVSKTIVNDHKHPPKFGIFPTVLQRGASFSRLTLQDRIITDTTGARALTLPGLEHLDLFFVSGGGTNAFIQSWLLPFARRHTYLSVIKFTDFAAGRGWGRIHSLDVPFAAPFLSALRTESIAGVKLDSVSIARPASWASLKDWDVIHLEVELLEAAAISAMELARACAPHLASVRVILPFVQPFESWNPPPCDINNFIEPFGSMPSLRTLYLTNGYRHLDADVPSPWTTALGRTQNTLGTAAWATALQALQWYMTRLAQRAAGLQYIHVSEQECGLQASFRVTARDGARELEMMGSPKVPS